MPLAPMRILLENAAEKGYGLAAFNVNNMEQIQAIMETGEKTESPVIIQASRGGRKYTNDAYLRHLMLAAAELHPKIRIAMRQDHGDSPETCLSAIKQGFTVRGNGGLLPGEGVRTVYRPKPIVSSKSGAGRDS
jgi:fructose-bisphosphate aldolase class II